MITIIITITVIMKGGASRTMKAGLAGKRGKKKDARGGRGLR